MNHGKCLMTEVRPMSLRQAIAEGGPAKLQGSNRDLIYDPLYVPSYLPPSSNEPAPIRDPPLTGLQRRASSTSLAVAGPSAPPLCMEVAVPDFPTLMTPADYDSPPPHTTISSPQTPRLSPSHPHITPSLLATKGQPHPRAYTAHPSHKDRQARCRQITLHLRS